MFTQASRVLKGELEHLLTINKSQRPWHIPLLSSLAICLPIFVGVYFNDLSSGIKASLGAMVILNLPLSGTLPFRLVTVMVWSFAMSFCFAIGLLTQQLPLLKLPVFVLMTFSVVVFGRYYQQSPPAGLFALMAGAIALFIPIPFEKILQATGLLMFGSVFALSLAAFYSLFLLSSRTVVSAPHYTFKADTIVESIIVATFTGFALFCAVLLQMPYPYWAALSCFIILQGMHLRTMWIKQFHRLLGTFIGVFLAAYLVTLDLHMWQIAASMLVLIMFIEVFIDRHYALAVIFITPLTVFIAEYGGGLAHSPLVYEQIISARLLDTALGCAIGFGGGVVMHSRFLRSPLRIVENSLLSYFASNKK